jgi:DNA-binding transcriptional regulator YhcF (GntR family)
MGNKKLKSCHRCHPLEEQPQASTPIYIQVTKYLKMASSNVRYHCHPLEVQPQVSTPIYIQVTKYLKMASSKVCYVW